MTHVPNDKVRLLPMVIAFAAALATANVAVPTRAQEAPSVIVTAVAERDVTPQFEYVGRVEAVETVDLRARVDGFLESRNFREGSEVKQGELLFVIEKASYNVTVQERQADLAVAEANLKNSESNYKRKKTLADQRNVSVANLDEALATLEIDKANVLKAKAALQQAELNLSYTEIRSPIAGKISRSTYSVGSLVGSNSEPLATITSIDPVHVVIAVSEKQLIAVRKRGIDLKKPPVTPSLVLGDGSIYDGSGDFDYLAPSVDQTTDTITARAVFANPNHVLLPGQFVSVIVRDKTKISKVVVPQSAVQQDSQGHFVLVVDRENKVELRRITTGHQNGLDWVIEEGLASGEKVIVQGIQKVRPDMAVKPVLQTGS